MPIIEIAQTAQPRTGNKGRGQVPAIARESAMTPITETAQAVAAAWREDAAGANAENEEMT